MLRSISILAVVLVLSRTAFSFLDIPEVRYQIKKSDLCIQISSTFNGHEKGVTNVMTPWTSFSQLKEGKINYNAEGGIQVLAFNGTKTKLSHAPNGLKEKRFKVIYLLSHELFHSWLGSKLEVPFHLRHKYRWFFEGFTDYFGLQAAKEQGYITAQEYADILNYHLVDYHSSFLSNMPNDLYDQAHRAGTINYNFIQTRGHLLAIHFQNLIIEKKLPADTLVHFYETQIATG